jgi:hypothetical protein
MSAHVSSVEAPITYMQEGVVKIADPNAADVIVGIPHKFDVVDHVSITPVTSYAVTAAPYISYTNKIQGPLAIGADYTADSTSLTLHADSPATADALNGFYIRIDSGANQGEIRKILDFASDVATLDAGFDNAMTSGTETYTILGTSIYVTADPTGGDPSWSYLVTGRP